MIRAVVAGLLSVLACGVQAASFDYKLHERLVQIADDTYVVLGDTTHFSRANGGNILNTAFIVSDDGVLVIDTGPSLRYGEQLRALISTVTDEAIALVINTHQHPDHFFGNQAFADNRIATTARARVDMAAHADAYSDAMYRLVGRAMFGTEYLLPNESIESSDLSFGSHSIEVLEMTGHTDSELVLFDRSTGVLFTGDLVFNGRAATTPHAQIENWLQTLDILEGYDYTTLVPGHGAIDRSRRAIKQTSDYLSWLQDRLRRAANTGATAAEALHQPVSPPFDQLGAMPAEYQRSVHHLFPALEEGSFYPPLSLERN